MLAKVKATYSRFSSRFWILVLTAFIDNLGRTMVFPFFSLYITQKFGVGMTETGILMGTFSLSGFVGGMIGGALTDRFGRKVMVLFGLVFSALSSMAFGLVNEFSLFFLIAISVGFLSDIAGPAHQAMVADLLPEEQRAEGYGLLRVAANLAWIIGPTVGGILAGYSYLLLFIIDAVTSLIVAVIVLKAIPETMPQRDAHREPESIASTFLGYFKVARDGLFVAFVVAMIFNILAYGQIYNALSVFLRDVHGLPASGYGSLMSANAVLVVLLQFWITARIRKRPPMLMMAVGTLLYGIGLTAYGLVSTYPYFLAAMLVITLGEMVVMPVSQALAAQFAPEDMRGRYMAFFSLAWVVPWAVGPVSAGVVLDNLNPNWLWYACGVCCAIAILAFMGLHTRSGARFTPIEQAQPAEG